MGRNYTILMQENLKMIGKYLEYTYLINIIKLHFNNGYSYNNLNAYVH